MSDVGSKEILPNIGQDKGKNSDPSVRPGPLHTSGRENTILEPVRRDAGSKRRGGGAGAVAERSLADLQRFQR